MFYHYNDYLIPVLIGSSREINAYAAEILKKKKARPHLFFNTFTFSQKLRFFCHKVLPAGDFWTFSALCDFAASLDEYYTPAIILCGKDNEDFYNKYAEELEKSYVVIKFDDYINDEGVQQ